MSISNRGPGPAAPPRRTDSRRPSRPARDGRQHRPHEWFARQLLLVLSGQRPVHTLLGHTRAPVYDHLSRLAPHTPLRPPAGDRQPTVRAVGYCRPDNEVIEAFARIDTSGRTRALAFRLERDARGRWQCAAIELDTVT